MKRIIVRIEPSKRLSDMLGFPYFIEKSFPFEDFVGVLTESNLEKLRMGEEIKKQLPVEVKDE